jgi:hypothetical protein
MAVAAARRPGGRILDVYRTSAERQGSYDFLENEAIKSDAMVDGIGLAIASDSQRHPYVLVSVDGGSLNIVDRQHTKGFGIVGNVSQSGRGLKVVTAYALEPDGTANRRARSTVVVARLDEQGQGVAPSKANRTKRNALLSRSDRAIVATT